jgi:hypothetical protein
LALSNTDGEALANEPVAAVLAVTRMRKPRAGTGAPRHDLRAHRFWRPSVRGLLDRLIVEVQPNSGLFHPKVWALRFERVGAPRGSEPAELGRVIVCSRNLSSSTSFELAAAFEGKATGDRDATHPFCSDTSSALQEWLEHAKARVPDAVWDLPQFVRSLELEVPREAEDGLRLGWQGLARRPLADLMPQKLERALVVSPFLQPAFLNRLMDRTSQLQVVSGPEALDALDDTTFGRLQALGERQGTPAAYQVTEHGDPEDSFIDGLHAKLLMTEDDGGQSATFIGSANGTGPGWGIGATVNVEAMAEMRPGIGISRFVSGFIRETKQKVHPWVMEYDRSSKTDPDPAMVAERQILAALREVAKMELCIVYKEGSQRLTIAHESRRSFQTLTNSLRRGCSSISRLSF